MWFIQHDTLFVAHAWYDSPNLVQLILAIGGLIGAIGTVITVIFQNGKTRTVVGTAASAAAAASTEARDAAAEAKTEAKNAAEVGKQTHSMVNGQRDEMIREMALLREENRALKGGRRKDEQTPPATP